MKYPVLALMTLISICLTQAQNPIPLPSLNINKTAGLWYVVMEYECNPPFEHSCATWNVKILNQTSILNTLMILDFGKIYYKESNIWAVSHNGSIWTWANSPIYWVAIDPVNGAWGTIASNVSQWAYVLSRTPTLDSKIIAAQIQLLQSEGFNIHYNESNFCILPNDNCDLPRDLYDI